MGRVEKREAKSEGLESRIKNQEGK
jgi:hypothetical protein